ncbi:MAG: hypothetical protein B0D88_09425, partial [Candidatus Sedimenticola endophacoides]
IVRTHIRLGEQVETEQQLATISDPFGNTETQVTSPGQGIIIGRSNLPLVNEGEALFHVARFRRKSDARQVTEAVGELELALSETEMQHATADVELWQAQIRRCTIHAPFDGRVVKVLAKPFQSVTLGEPLIEILDDSTYRMELFVPSSWYGRIRPGTRFRVRIDETGRDYPAVVTELGARINPVAQTLGISAEITGDSTDLLAGMSGSALFEDQDGE